MARLWISWLQPLYLTELMLVVLLNGFRLSYPWLGYDVIVALLILDAGC